MKKYELRMKGDPRYLTTLIEEEEFKLFKEMTSKDVRESRKAWMTASMFTQLRAWFQTEDGNIVQQNDSFWKDVTIDDFVKKSDEEFLALLKERGRGLGHTVKYHPTTGKKRYVTRLTMPEFDGELFASSLAELFIRFYFAAYTNRILRADKSFEHYVDKWIVANRYHDYNSLVKARNEYLEVMGKVIEAMEETANEVADELCGKQTEELPEETKQTEPVATE